MGSSTCVRTANLNQWPSPRRLRCETYSNSPQIEVFGYLYDEDDPRGSFLPLARSRPVLTKTATTPKRNEPVPLPQTFSAEIAQRGRMQVSVQPRLFTEDRVDAGRLESFIASQVVRMRGWPLPYISPRQPVFSFDDSIGQDVPAPERAAPLRA